MRAFLTRSPRICHRNELTDRDWENAVQGLGNLKTTEKVKAGWGIGMQGGRNTEYWDLFLQKTDNFSGLKANFEIKTS